MSYPIFFEIDSNEIFVWHPDLPGCHTDGRSFEEAIERLADARELWLDVAEERGMNIPAPWQLIGKPRLVNLTPHNIVVFTDEKRGFIVPPSGTVARVSVRQEEVGTIEVEDLNVPIVKNSWGEVTGLPEPQPGVVYIVSALVLSRVKGRHDVVAPDTGPTAIRDENGRIIGVRRFILPEE